ncbi:MAG: amidohydrolase [Planctomycetes bacterium]|nr:amidohydrolase [Planctomycetota bacterium]MCP4771460.1 amidohydrolase [Planctomycetota bacterium]
MILFNGLVYTQAEPQRIVEAIAIQDGRVLAIGDDSDILALANSNTQRFDLEGRAVYPGFADGHAHLVGVGTSLENLDLMGTTSYQQVIERAVAKHQELPKGEWLFGRGWDQNDWREKSFPTHHALSKAIPDRPVVLVRVDGHALLANQAAMDAAGITRATADPEGGRLERDVEGHPTGVFVDNAEMLIQAAAPGTTIDAVKRAVGAATAAFHAQGITAVHDAGAGEATLAYLESMATEGRLQLRLHEMLHGSDPELLKRRFAAGPVADFGGKGTLAIRAVKIYTDGALGSRGAALLEEYSDDHGNHGLLITSDAKRKAIVMDALAADFQVATHAIGDRGNRQTLDVYEQAFAEADAQDEADQDRRWRIEHAQVIHPEDFKRFADLGVIPAMQAQHQTSDMPWAEDRVGPERILGAYAWRSFLNVGCVIPGGSDAPVERLDTVAQFIAAVTRATPEGEPEGGWYPEQNLTRQEALNMLTTWPAYAAFREHDLGRLEQGFRADMVIFSADLMTLPLDQLADCKPVLTIFNGEVVWVEQ